MADQETVHVVAQTRPPAYLRRKRGRVPGDTGFGDVRLVHNALPECDMRSIDLSTRFFGHTLSSPLFISAMTGGHPGQGDKCPPCPDSPNVSASAWAWRFQRAALENPALADTFSVVRDEAPHAFLVANLGAVQLRDHGTAWAEEAIGMIGANAIAIHLNFLQEAIQPEGDHNATGLPCRDRRALCGDKAR